MFIIEKTMVEMLYFPQFGITNILTVATLALARDQGKGVAKLRAYK
jgi:hypothetical protein